MILGGWVVPLVLGVTTIDNFDSTPSAPNGPEEVTRETSGNQITVEIGAGSSLPVGSLNNATNPGLHLAAAVGVPFGSGAWRYQPEGLAMISTFPLARERAENDQLVWAVGAGLRLSRMVGETSSLYARPHVTYAATTSAAQDFDGPSGVAVGARFGFDFGLAHGLSMGPAAEYTAFLNGDRFDTYQWISVGLNIQLRFMPGG